MSNRKRCVSCNGITSLSDEICKKCRKKRRTGHLHSSQINRVGQTVGNALDETGQDNNFEMGQQHSNNNTNKPEDTDSTVNDDENVTEIIQQDNDSEDKNYSDIESKDLCAVSQLHPPPKKGKWKIIASSECCDNSYVGPNIENKQLLGVLISLKHCTKVAGNILVKNYDKNSSGARKMSSEGRNSSMKYDRMALFADLKSSTGACFIIIFRNAADSHAAFRYSLTSGVGQVFCIEEPKPIVNFLGDTMSVAVVENRKYLCPVSNHMKQILPTVPLKTPIAGATSFFSYHKIKIAISCVIISDAKCTGTFCDRQEHLTSTQMCGCFHTSKYASGGVLTMDVTFSTEDETHIVQDFRSLRTSNLFLEDNSVWDRLGKISHVDSDADDFIREACKNFVTYVNDNGGWTLLGWLRTGTTSDSSNSSGEVVNIASQTTSPHLAYVYPTALDLPNLNTWEIKNCEEGLQANELIYKFNYT